tara:strand:- start:1148 stop:1912 length:765 start_codon:yes stop_codon:yes gene_type:complete
MNLTIIHKFTLYILFLGLINAKNDSNEIFLGDIVSNKENYDEHIINRSLGFHEITGFEQTDSSNGIILVHGFYPFGWSSKGFEWAEPIKNFSKAGLPMWLYRYDWNQCPSITATQINSDLATLLEKNSHLESIIIIGHSFGGLIVTLFSESWNSSFPIDAHVIASGLAKSKFDRKYLNCKDPKKSKYYISKNVEYKQWRTIKNQDGIFKKLKNDPQVVTFINGKTTLLPKKWKSTRVGHNFSILVVSDIILSDL